MESSVSKQICLNCVLFLDHATGMEHSYSKYNRISDRNTYLISRIRVGCLPVNLCDSCLSADGADTSREALWIREKAVVVVIRHLSLQEIARNCFDEYSILLEVKKYCLFLFIRTFSLLLNIYVCDDLNLYLNLRE